MVTVEKLLFIFGSIVGRPTTPKHLVIKVKPWLFYS